MRHLAALALAAMCAVTPARADDDCSQFLVTATTSESGASVQNLSLAWSLSEESYQKAKAAAGAQGVLFGIPVSDTYARFRDEIRTGAKQAGLVNFDQWSFPFATSGISQESRSAYVACLQANSAGLVFFAKTISATFYLLRLQYAAPQDATTVNGMLAGYANIQDADASGMRINLSSVKFTGAVAQEYIVKPVTRTQEAAIAIMIGPRVISLVLPPLERAPPPAEPK